MDFVNSKFQYQYYLSFLQKQNPIFIYAILAAKPDTDSTPSATIFIWKHLEICPNITLKHIPDSAQNIQGSSKRINKIRTVRSKMDIFFPNRLK